MDSVKVKNFIILVLVIVDLALLVLVVRDAARGSEQRKEAIEGAREVLLSHGISVSEDADLGEREGSSYSVSRSDEAERLAAEAIFGEVEVIDRGGGIVMYSAVSGEVTFRGAGGLEMQYYGISAPETDEPEKLALEMSRTLGAEAYSEDISSVTEGETTTVSVGCSWMGSRIVNCELNYTFKGGKLLYVSGSRPLGESSSERLEEIIDVPTVLMRFIELTQQQGHVCSMLEELELCYLYSGTASGGGSLSPVWQLRTDTGYFYINAITGKEESVS
ncbi:MAG TPA: hypothetical protein IAD42_04680 [Candidatus Scatomorpha pullistercoris]|uniref:Regulatory protein YycH-like domain-containing protein n=1 Tax=Candidatus Scatomorpha pullistercoris TaxID=2840929 RepID=A0A9D1G595_9FIRM|nr:hypothetical protein [Candidatus Scatomorpha pullistercoris]